MVNIIFRYLTLLIFLLFFIPYSYSDAYDLNQQLGRAINMGNMLEGPDEGEWGLFLEEEYFDLINQAGFTGVRIPVRWSAHALKEPPYTIDSTWMNRVKLAVDQALERNLTVVLNMHHYNEIFEEPIVHKERFIEMWKQISQTFDGYPETLFFEFLNEPHNNLSGIFWNKLLLELIPIIREQHPNRIFVIGPVNYNNIDSVGNLRRLPEDDRNIIITIHYYSPFEFTHQGAEWVGGNAYDWLGTTWTGTESQKNAILDKFDYLQEWSQENNRPIFLGEFGAYSKADLDSRVLWTNFIAREAESRGWSWAYWEFGAGFGAYNPDAERWRLPILEALIPPTHIKLFNIY